MTLAFVQVKHRLNKRHHFVVPCFVGAISEVDRANWQLFNKLLIGGDITAPKVGSDLFEIEVKQA